MDGYSYNSFEAFGNQFKPQILAQINQGVQGDSYKINKRKTLKIHKLQSISFDGCRIKGNLKVTLKRKVRRDAHGNEKIRADITSFNLANKKFCFKNAKVTNVNLALLNHEMISPNFQRFFNRFKR